MKECQFWNNLNKMSMQIWLLSNDYNKMSTQEWLFMNDYNKMSTQEWLFTNDYNKMSMYLGITSQNVFARMTIEEWLQ